MKATIGLVFSEILEKYTKFSLISQILCNLQGFPVKFCLNDFKFYSKNTMLQVKLGHYCAYMSVFKDRKFKTSVIITYFNIFQLKLIVQADNIHDFTKISIFSLFKVEICSSKFQICDTFSHFSQFSYHTQLVVVLALYALISHHCLVVSK